MTIMDTIHVAKVLANLRIDDETLTKVMIAFADDFERSFVRSKSFKRHEFIAKFWKLHALAQQRQVPIARKYTRKNSQPTTD